jgi:diguanylate cyclase (GGDEF)-like protein
VDLPPRAIAWVLGVELTAVVVAVAAIEGPPSRSALGLAALLAALSVAHTELATGIERIRRRVAHTSYFDLSSVWTFAAAMLLPPPLAALVVVVVYAHLWQRVWRPARVPLHRHLYTTATVVLAVTAAHAVVDGAGGLPTGPEDVAGALGVVAAVLAYVVVNTVLIAVAIGLSRQRADARELMGRWDDNALEIATLCMGGLAAVALGDAPWLVALALPPVLVLHRAVQVRQLEEVASMDGKTGLLNAATWQARATRAVRDARRAGAGVGVLIVDLDHFKAVNDEHGHLAGDDVLAAVASALRTGVRTQDLVGRFGGEEFVVLVRARPAGSAGRVELAAVAERLRRQIARLTVPALDSSSVIDGLTASVGAACVVTDRGLDRACLDGIRPGRSDLDGGDLDRADLDGALRAADACLYAAKRGGRNLVRVAGEPEVPAPRPAGDALGRATSGVDALP